MNDGEKNQLLDIATVMLKQLHVEIKNVDKSQLKHSVHNFPLLLKICLLFYGHGRSMGNTFQFYNSALTIFKNNTKNMKELEWVFPDSAENTVNVHNINGEKSITVHIPYQPREIFPDDSESQCLSLLHFIFFNSKDVGNNASVKQKLKEVYDAMKTFSNDDIEIILERTKWQGIEGKLYPVFKSKKLDSNELQQILYYIHAEIMSIKPDTSEGNVLLESYGFSSTKSVPKTLPKNTSVSHENASTIIQTILDQSALVKEDVENAMKNLKIKIEAPIKPTTKGGKQIPLTEYFTNYIQSPTFRTKFSPGVPRIQINGQFKVLFYQLKHMTPVMVGEKLTFTDLARIMFSDKATYSIITGTFGEIFKKCEPDEFAAYIAVKK